MNPVRFQLLKYTSPASRETCPHCGKKKEFTPYVDTKTGELLPLDYGRCNRQDKCSYFLSPYHKNANGVSYADAIRESERLENPLHLPTHKIQNKPKIKEQPMKVYIDTETAERTLKTSYFAQNNFVRFVLSLCKNDDEKKRAIEVLLAYKVGTCSEGCVFWFCDDQNQYHAGQVKDFDLTTGKTTNTTWIHTVLHKQGLAGSFLRKDYDKSEKVGCLFGEHLLALPENKHKTIILMESPKNALISAMFLPQDDKIYLATYSLSAFTPERCDAIVGKKVLLLPDLGKGTETWKSTAPKFLPAGSFSFMNMLESMASEQDRKEGADIADFIIRDRKTAPIPLDLYLKELKTINGIVCRVDSEGKAYPASWDFNAPYVTKEVQDYCDAL